MHFSWATVTLNRAEPGIPAPLNGVVSTPDHIPIAGASAAFAFAAPLPLTLLFMPIFAGLRNIPLAAADIVIVWATILWCMVVVWPHYRWVAVAQVPYFVWVSIATVLQLSITAMNWGNP